LEHSRTPVTAVLGTGVMGSAMARNAVRAGLEVRAWSVPLEDATRLESDGVRAAATASEAAAGARIVVTMVPDAPAIESFAAGGDGFLGSMEEGAVWLQASTVGAAPADRLIALAAEHSVAIVDSPVLGSKDPAERGELVMLASGEDEHLDLCEPFFEAVARRVLRLGRAGNGSRLKMVTNGWIMSAVGAIAEAMALAEAFGLDPRSFMAAIEGTPMDMGYAQIKGGMIADGVYPVQMTLANGAKDAQLALEASRALGLPARVIGAAAELLATARDLGWAGDDMAAAYNAAVASAIEKRELQGDE
jgi:3-hydroxyisobutyrate dehydrogenase